MEFEKLVSPSLKDLFITHIEAMILSGELPVGQQLPPERQLAQSMGVSRAVVNSGVAELERRGFLEVRPRVGTFVTDYRRAGTLDTLKSIMTYNRGRPAQRGDPLYSGDPGRPGQAGGGGDHRLRLGGGHRRPVPGGGGHPRGRGQPPCGGGGLCLPA